MAGGPIFPTSVYLGGGSGNIFPNFYAGAGGNASPTDEGIGVVASLGADAAAQLRFPLPESLPSGTAKLRFLSLANATSGTAKWTVSDGVVAAGSSPSAATLTSETQSTLTWSAGNNDQYLETKVTLTPSMVANSMLVVAVTYNHTSWTLAQTLTQIVSLVWE